MAEALAVTLHAMGEETTDGSSAAVDIGERRSAARVVLQIADGSSLALVVYVETSSEEAGPFRRSATLPLRNSPGRVEFNVANLLQYVRVSWTMAATGTFAVTGEAHTLYATPNQIALNADVLGGYLDEVKAEACITASGEGEAYVGSGYVLPLTSWSPELTRQVGMIAAWNLIRSQGIRADGADELIMKGRDDAIRWFDKVANGKLAPPGIVDSTPEVYDAGSYTVSDAVR